MTQRFVRLLMIIVLVFFLLLGIIACTNRTANLSANRQRQLRGMADIVNALRDYDQAFGRLPESVAVDSAGNELYSWRFSILRFREGLGKRRPNLKARWDSPSNYEFSQRADYIYCFGRDNGVRSKACNIAVIEGPGTPFPRSGAISMSEIPPDTVLIIEAKNVSSHWMAPGDLQFQLIDRSLTLGTDGMGVAVGFADGEAWLLDKDVPISTLKCFFMVRPDMQRDRHRDLGPYVITTWKERG